MSKSKSQIQNINLYLTLQIPTIGKAKVSVNGNSVTVNMGMVTLVKIGDELRMFVYDDMYGEVDNNKLKERLWELVSKHVKLTLGEVGKLFQ